MQVDEAAPRPSSEFITGPPNRKADTAILLGIAAAIGLLHVLTNGRYGFHRDELQFLSDARHLDWGYVAYPPFTAVLQRIGLEIFGISLIGLRLFSVLAQCAAILVSGLMARELGGARGAQVTAALATAFSPISLFEGAEFQYTSFDFLWWVLTAYFLLRLLNSEDPRWWLAIGVVTGVGLETKYSIVFYIAGMIVGLIFTPARRFMKSAWFWAGTAVAFLIFTPNLLWLIRNDFVSYRFLQHIHARDIAIGRASTFLRDQFTLCANLAAVPLWLAGFAGFVLNRRYRMMAFLAAVPIGILWIARGRGYYTAGVYPMLVAMGAVIAERWIVWMPRPTRYMIGIAWYSVFAIVAAFLSAILIPFATAGPLRQFALEHNSDMREEFGWTELAHTVAEIRDTLPADQRSSVGVLTGNYGEQGALEIYGPAYQLPEPIGIANSAWRRGYPKPAPTMLIVLGFSRADVEREFNGCRLAGKNKNSNGVKNEESLFHSEIFVCGSPRKGWAQFWRENESFG